MTMPKLLLIDGHSSAFRAFYGLPLENFQTSSGEPTNAVFGFTRMLINLLRDEKPTHVAVAFDVSRQTFRQAKYADYKGTRKETPSEFKPQIGLIKQVLDAANVVHFEKEGYEADDIIATLAKAADASGWEVIIATGDRDSFQLVSDSITVLYPRQRISDLARMTPAAVLEKYLVTPKQYPDLAALVGDSSDNLVGVPGVGPKTAAKWINQYGSLEELLANKAEITGKVGDALREHVENVERNRHLNELVSDLDFGGGLADTERKSPNREAVNQLFDTLEFHRLREELIKLQPVAGEEQIEESQPAEEITDVEEHEINPGELAKWLKKHASDKTGLAVLGAWSRGTGEVDSIAFVGKKGAAAFIDVADLNAEDEQALAAWLADKSKPKIMHDAKGPIEAFNARGWTFAGLVFDTQLAAYLLKPDQRSYELSDLSVSYLQREIEEAESGQLFDESARANAIVNAKAALDLSLVLEKKLGKEVSLLHDMEIPLLAILAKMEVVGIALDLDYLASLESEFGARAQEAANAAFESIGKEVNLGSPKQLQEVLFEQLNLPKTKKIKTGYTTDAEALQSLFVQTGHPFLENLLAHRDVTKLRQTVEGLRKSVSDDGRVHTTFQQTVAATGRLSSKDPNLQNIPIRTESGRRIRAAFVVGKGYETLLTADYSQIEMRIMAHLSEDEYVINAFKSGEDFHTVMAAMVFAVEPQNVTTELRNRVKQMNYGLAYGLSAYGLSQRLTIPPGEAQKLMDEYFAHFGKVKKYLDSVVDQARMDGYTETMWGRRRYLPDLNSDNRQRRDMAERMALNAPIQGSAADLIKIAMINLDRALTEKELKSRMLLQVHDELILEVAKGEAKIVEELVRENMGNAAELKVPLEVSVGVGANWFDAAH